MSPDATTGKSGTSSQSQAELKSARSESKHVSTIGSKSYLFLQLGTPHTPSYFGVGRFLWDFLTDWQVIDLPWGIRHILVGLLIIPLRIRKVVHSYRAIWTPSGSPLRTHSEVFVEEVRALCPGVAIELAMTYDRGGVGQALRRLQTQSPGAKIVVLPLYPQYAASSTGAALSRLYLESSKMWDPPALEVILDFYDKSFFIGALSASIIEKLRSLDQPADLLVLSFHGVPLRHLEKSKCHLVQSCGEGECPAKDFPKLCYPAQCYTTKRHIEVELRKGGFCTEIGVVFQSRVGSLPWTGPNLVEQMKVWKERGIKRIVIATPSFTVDCLETLEEIAMSFREEWESEVEGGHVEVIACLNSSPEWVRGVAKELLSV